MVAKNSKAYPAFFFRQRPASPIQCTFVASSADISEWAAVPTKETGDLRNFQRPELDDHVDEIREFFQNHTTNCSPSSIVLGFRDPPTCLNSDGMPLDFDSIAVGDVLPGTLKIEYTSIAALEEGEQRTHLKELVARQVQKLSQSLSASAMVQDPTPATDDGEPDDADAESNGDSSVDELDQSEIARARRNSIETLQSLAVDSLPTSELLQWLATLGDIEKPGLIIDGQHRVKGTQSELVLFSVTALPVAQWEELAFQFIVLNKSARKVPDGLLINIVGNSLSTSELQKIEQRLNDSGIQVPLYQGVMRIHDDPESPFYKKLRFGIEKDEGIIDAAAAKTRIVNFWFKCTRYGLFEHLIPEGKTKTEKIQHWQASGLWYEFFKAFWQPAKQIYEQNSELWSNSVDENGTPVSRLMQVMILSLTQEVITAFALERAREEIDDDIEQKKTMLTQLPDIDAFRKKIEFYFRRVKPEFFADWSDAATGFGGSKAVKDWYREALRDVISATKTIQDLKSSGQKGSPLFKK